MPMIGRLKVAHRLLKKNNLALEQTILRLLALQNSPKTLSLSNGTVL